RDRRRLVDGPMVLVPVVVEHGVDAPGRDLLHLFLDNSDQFVEMLVQASVGEVMLDDLLDAEAGQRLSRFRAAIEPAFGAAATIAQDHRRDAGASCYLRCQSGAAP